MDWDALQLSEGRLGTQDGAEGILLLHLFLAWGVSLFEPGTSLSVTWLDMVFSYVFLPFGTYSPF